MQANPSAPDCTVRIAAGDPIEPHLAEGAVLCLGPGRHAGNLEIEHGLTLRGEPGAVLDAGGRGPVLLVLADDARVVIESVEITGGHAELGAGIQVEGMSEVHLDKVVLRGNKAGGGGGAIGAARGRLQMRGCTVQGGVMITNIAQARIEGSSIDELVAREGARVEVQGGRIGELDLRGTTTRAPEVKLSGVQVDTIENDSQLPGRLVKE